MSKETLSALDYSTGNIPLAGSQTRAIPFLESYGKDIRASQARVDEIRRQNVNRQLERAKLEAQTEQNRIANIRADALAKRQQATFDRENRERAALLKARELEATGAFEVDPMTKGYRDPTEIAELKTTARQTIDEYNPEYAPTYSPENIQKAETLQARINAIGDTSEKDVDVRHDKATRDIKAKVTAGEMYPEEGERLLKDSKLRRQADKDAILGKREKQGFFESDAYYKRRLASKDKLLREETMVKRNEKKALLKEQKNLLTSMNIKGRESLAARDKDIAEFKKGVVKEVNAAISKDKTPTQLRMTGNELKRDFMQNNPQANAEVRSAAFTVIDNKIKARLDAISGVAKEKQELKTFAAKEAIKTKESKELEATKTLNRMAEEQAKFKLKQEEGGITEQQAQDYKKYELAFKTLADEDSSSASQKAAKRTLRWYDKKYPDR